MNNIRGNYIDRLGFNRERDQPAEPKSAGLANRGTATSRFSVDTYMDQRNGNNVNLTVVRDTQMPKEMQRMEMQLNQQDSSSQKQNG